jgi:hypothetical protein
MDMRPCYNVDARKRAVNDYRRRVVVPLVNKSSLGKATNPRFNKLSELKASRSSCIRSKSFLPPKRISESWFPMGIPQDLARLCD